MGQGYNAIILDESGNIIRTWINPHNYNNGYKLMEHSYIGNNFVSVVEFLLSPEGMFYKSRLVWAGDYADTELTSDDDNNLYHMSFDLGGRESVGLPKADTSTYRYIVNHTKKLYVDKNLEFSGNIHPLPLLTAEGNGRGGGDYSGASEDLVGTWARDVISVEKDLPAGFTELECPFGE
jgi:hypothetical protein